MSPGDELPAIRAALAPSKPLAAPPKPMGAEERSKRLHSDLSFASFGADQRAMIEGAIREADSAAFNRGVVHSACYARDRFGENHILVADILALKDKCFVVRP